ncbi:protein ALP1-like [Malus domestica]|uniref:protein ALP1-like n=1 Tax=Malus domestica TaxID=3750 RepID=UPI003974729F
MERHLFNKIMIAICNHDSYFVQKNDAFGAMSLMHEQKIIVALRMLAYGASTNQVDKIVRMGKSTILESLMRFCKVIESIYTIEYLRIPTEIDLQRLLKKGEMRGFPGMIGSIDLFNGVLQGKAPKVPYWVNGHKYDGPYYLADDIYPRWSSFVKTVPRPQSAKEKHFASCQEGCRKDVEHCFGILQTRWAIVKGATKMFDLESLRSIMMTCIILHNMIVEYEYDYDAVNEYEPNTMNNSRTQIYCAHDATKEPVQLEPLERDGRYKEMLIQRYIALQRPYMHNVRQIDLIEHQWELKQAQDT